MSHFPTYLRARLESCGATMKQLAIRIGWDACVLSRRIHGKVSDIDEALEVGLKIGAALHEIETEKTTRTRTLRCA